VRKRIVYKETKCGRRRRRRRRRRKWRQYHVIRAEVDLDHSLRFGESVHDALPLEAEDL
jgi:hypothetical protein